MLYVVTPGDVKDFLENFGRVKQSVDEHPRYSRREILNNMYMIRLITDTGSGYLAWEQTAEDVYTAVVGGKTVCLWNQKQGDGAKLSIGLEESISHTIVGECVNALWEKVKGTQESAIERYMRRVVEEGK